MQHRCRLQIELSLQLFYLKKKNPEEKQNNPKNTNAEEALQYCLKLKDLLNKYMP